LSIQGIGFRPRRSEGKRRSNSEGEEVLYNERSKTVTRSRDSPSLEGRVGGHGPTKRTKRRTF